MRSFFVSLFALLTLSASAVDTKWFEDARFGMFVHFGPYAVLGSGEWVMLNRSIPRDNYKSLQDFFNPAKFDAKAWVKAAKDAGMKYIVITSRHHDGFSMWDTKQSEWNIMNTPYGKDILRQLADECRKEGIKLGFYYSLLDWFREDYQWNTGRRNKELGRDAAKIDWEGYIAFMKAQLTELLTNYGDIAVIWFDGHWDQTINEEKTDTYTKVNWHYDEIYGLIKRLQPNCLIANNHHLTAQPGEDYQIFERDLPGENTAGYGGAEVSKTLPLEMCQTIGAAWGYNIMDTNIKPSRELIHLLVRAAGYGSNLLLNVGPMPDGRIDPVSVKRMAEVGAWLGKWGHTIYGTQAGFVKPQEWGAVTKKGNTYYVHVFDAPQGTLTLDVPKFKKARLLSGEGNLGVVYKKGVLTLTMPQTPDTVDTIIEITVK